MSQCASGIKKSHPRILSKAAIMSAGTMTSRVLGLFRDILMAAYFDRRVTDAWTAAFRIPNFFRRVFGEGSLGVSFIPLFIDLQEQDSSQARARNLANGFYTLLLLFLAVLTLLGIFFMQPLLSFLLDAQYLADPERLQLTLRMAQIMFGFVFCVVNFAFLMGLLQALGEFAWPALAPALLNLSMLGFIFLPTEFFRFHGEALAWGVLFGGLLQAGVLIPVLHKKNYLPRLTVDFNTADVRKLLMRIMPGVVGAGLVQILSLVNLRFASSLGAGTLSAIYWADRLLELPLSLVAVSLSSALLPSLSQLWSQKNKAHMLKLESEQLIVNGLWVIPSAIGLWVMAEPIVEVLFMRGQFGVADLHRTTLILQIYALSMFVQSLARLLLPLLYAAQRVWEASLSSVLTVVLHLFLAPLMMREGGLSGLIWATFLSACFHALCIFVFVVRLYGVPKWSDVIRRYLQFVLFSVGIFLCPWIYQGALTLIHVKVIALAVSLLFAAGTYLGGCYWGGFYRLLVKEK